MKQLRIQRCWLLISLWLLTACAGVEAEEKMDSIHCNLKIDPSIQLGQPVMLQLTLHNSTSQSLEVLQYFTPFEGILGEIFELHFNGEPLSYRGPLVKRGPPLDEDWLRLEPGGDLSAEVDISHAWNLGRKGGYRLQLRNDIAYRPAGSTERQVLAAERCPEVRFSVF